MNLISIAFSDTMMSFNNDTHQKLWRFLGFMSSVVGFICYAFSPSFQDLFGHWTLFTIILYPALSTIFSILTLFVNKFSQFSRVFLLKAPAGFLVLVLTSLYSFYEDRSSGKYGDDDKGVLRNMLCPLSFAAFAFMSVSLSKQIQPEFDDVGVANFFLGCLIVAIMKMNVKIALGISAFFYVLIAVRSRWGSQIGDTELELMAQLNEMQTPAEDDDDNQEMPSLENEGHGELDAIDDEGMQEAGTGGGCDNIEGLWYQAYRWAQQHASPPRDESRKAWNLFFH